MLNHDPNHKEIAWQIKFQFANTLSWPVRLNIEEIRVVIENMAPDLPSLNMGSAFIIPGKSKAMWSSGGYSKEFFKIKDIMNGKVYISYKYGHPDDGYSRMATKELSIECNMRGMALEFGGPVAIGVTPSIEADTPIA